MIDPGHGGRDPGAVGKIAHEKDIALNLSLKLEKLLKKHDPDIQVFLTRKTDVYVDLAKRAKMANDKHANLFISVHLNANVKKDIFGTESYAVGVHKNDAQFDVMKRENSVILLEDDYKVTYDGFDPRSPDSYIIFKLQQHAFLTQSLDLARQVEHQFSQHAKRTSRGVKQAGFLVLWQAAMPAILVEAGFISNEEEEKYLTTNEGQDQLAAALHKGIQTYRKSIAER